MILGDLSVQRCSETECDGSHVLVMIGHQGEATEQARHVTDAAGARHIAAMLCQAAEIIEARGLAPKPH